MIQNKWNTEINIKKNNKYLKRARIGYTDDTEKQYTVIKKKQIDLLGIKI